MINKLILFCLKNKFLVTAVTVILFVVGLLTAPFDWNIYDLPRYPVPVDAIPDIGENQQIVFTEWMGRSPRDVEDQITYPLTVGMLGIPGVKTVRSYSMFGFSTIYVIFEEDVEFYWSRSRILEKLASLPTGTLPKEVNPSLGPDATALGQVFWYTLEGRDEDGIPTGGWDLDELRSIQDYYVRYGLMSANGIAEVASVGGHVREYQIDVNPGEMFTYKVLLQDIYKAVQMSNVDVGARTIEINKVEYVIRGLGFIKTVEDINETVVKVVNNVPIKIKQIANVTLGPALRRGALDKEGVEAVGGVAVVRYGENPLSAIKNIKDKIREISPGLPQKMLEDGTLSQVTIIPFYDRTELIHETLNTLKDALTDEIIITIIVVLFLVMNIKAAFIISGLLPLAVIFTFIGMKYFGVDANVVALSGIAIAIGTIVDMGIILTENILRHFKSANPEESSLDIIFQASKEVSGAILTAISTTIISFLPIFTLEGAEGKLFKPLAFTKTFALISSVIITLTILPALAHFIFGNQHKKNEDNKIIPIIFGVIGFGILFTSAWWVGIFFLLYCFYNLFHNKIKILHRFKKENINIALPIILMMLLLNNHWQPLKQQAGFFYNSLFVLFILFFILGSMFFLNKYYKHILHWCIDNRKFTAIVPAIFIVLGMTIWLGFNSIFSFIPDPILKSKPFASISRVFPGLGREFMPNFDEGSFLYMPTTMPHASIGEALNVLSKIDMAINSVPEVENVVGKIGRAETPLDPAPVSMIETVIGVIPEYKMENGIEVRQWRDHIKSMDDIWNEIVKVAQIPGTTSAPKLMPIATRIVMLQSGMRAPIGIKVKGPDLETIEKVSLELEKYIKEVDGVNPATVFADRIVGKPYLEIEINRSAIARYGLHIRDVQNVIEIGIGGKTLTTTVEGRERYPVRVRYSRELRNELEDLEKILVPTPDGKQIPLIQLASINYVRGPQMIKSEDTFLIGYVIFDKLKAFSEVDVVENATQYLNQKIKSGEISIPKGVNYNFTGTYENQIRATKKLSIILPLALGLIFIILYLQFKEIKIIWLIFLGIFIAWSGGFILIWFYNQPWFMNFFGLRDVFHIGTTNMSVAIWVGFLALFGIASDDGVIMATYIKQRILEMTPKTKTEIKEAVIYAASRRARAALMTTATTILALVPILTSTGKGADIMIPMAIPVFGGISLVIISIFITPVFYIWLEENKQQTER